MADQATVDAYNNIAEEYHSRNSVTMYTKEYGIFESMFGSSKSVLEIGCGTGRDSKVLIGLGFDHVGIDASEGMLKIAQELVPEGKFKVGDFYNLEFSDNHFDGFWAAATFLHVPKADMPKILAEARRVIKPNGVGFISVKQKKGMDEGYIESKTTGTKRYFAFYEKEEFANILKENNFEVVKINEDIEQDGTPWFYYFVKSLK
ncbi:MAG: class I SAM-dependent methyltransferase [Candidatus Pacebacteria bacterium]|nr:class I SAM-dependent methyltransferase [Candidatus Paceibacterota bacterium]